MQSLQTQFLNFIGTEAEPPRVARYAEANTAALVALKWWASDGGPRVVHATPPLHDGISADINCTSQRYFLCGRQSALVSESGGAIGMALGDVREKGALIGALA